MNNKVIVQFKFWSTAVGIFVKRLFFSVVSQGGLVLYTGLINHHVDWHAVGYAAAVQGLYIVLTAVRDVRDPALPTVPSQKVEITKG